MDAAATLTSVSSFRQSGWAIASLAVFAVAVASARMLRALGGPLSVGAAPVRVSHLLVLTSFVLALVPAIRVWQHRHTLRPGERLVGLLPLVVAGLGVLWVAAFQVWPPD